MQKDYANELDALFRALNEPQAGELTKNLKMMYAARNDSKRYQLLMDILVTDGYIDKETDIPTAIGRRFYAFGSYSAEKKTAFRKRLWEWAVIFATVINSLAILYLTYLSIRK